MLKRLKARLLGLGEGLVCAARWGQVTLPFRNSCRLLCKLMFLFSPRCVWLHRNSFDLCRTQGFFGPLAQIAPVGTVAWGLLILPKDEEGKDTLSQI